MQTQYRVAWPPFTKSVIALAAAFFLIWFGSVMIEPFGAFAAEHLYLTAANVSELEVWTVLTYSVFHQNFFGVFFSAFAVWIFGGELQEAWGERKWWIVQLAAVVLGGGLVFVAQWLFDAQKPVLGWHAAVIALLAAFCRRAWNRKLSLFVVEMTGKTMLLFFLGLNVVLIIVGGHYLVLALDAAGLLVGFAAVDRFFHPRDLKTRLRRWWVRRRLKVVPRTPEDDESPRKTKDGKWIN